MGHKKVTFVLLTQEIMSVEGVRILAPVLGEHAQILTPEAIKFLTVLHRNFETERQERLKARAVRQVELDGGKTLDFLPQTRHIREDPAWRCAPPSPGLRDRRVEITGPVDRKMVINALNSGAYTYMADFEDSNSPTWANNLDGQVNLRDAINRRVDFKASNGKQYKLRPVHELATLIVRPRGWHLNEESFLVDGKPISGGLFDFGLFFFHNAHQLVKNGFGPYFYLPKMESHLEARLWNDVFNLSQDYIKMPRGTIRGTVLIETITAAFEMEEILYELREHSSGLNCGRWDYIFSFIKRQRYNRSAVLPDRATVTMTCPFMQAYVNLLIQTCHKRGVAAIGGMAAQIPIKDDPKANDAAMEKVRADKLRDGQRGCQARAFDAEQVDEARYPMHLLPVDAEIGGGSAGAGEFRADAAIGRRQRILRQPRPVFTDLRLEMAPPGTVHPVIDGLDPVHIRAEAHPARKV